MRFLRSIALVTVLAGLGWFEFGQDRSSGELAQLVRDYSDPRPARRILLLGNSRTSGHDMPGMLRQIADSAIVPRWVV